MPNFYDQQILHRLKWQTTKATERERRAYIVMLRTIFRKLEQYDSERWNNLDSMKEIVVTDGLTPCGEEADGCCTYDGIYMRWRNDVDWSTLAAIASMEAAHYFIIDEFGSILLSNDAIHYAANCYELVQMSSLLPAVASQLEDWEKHLCFEETIRVQTVWEYLRRIPPIEIKILHYNIKLIVEKRHVMMDKIRNGIAIKGPHKYWLGIGDMRRTPGEADNHHRHY